MQTRDILKALAAGTTIGFAVVGLKQTSSDLFAQYALDDPTCSVSANLLNEVATFGVTSAVSTAWSWIYLWQKKQAENNPEKQNLVETPAPRTYSA